MSLSVLESVTRQAGSAVQSTVGRTAADVRRETSITAWANRLLADRAKQRRTFRGSRDEGVYILSAEDVRRGRRMGDRTFVTPDGYVRRTPVQELVVDPAYYRRLALRALSLAVSAAVAALVLYVVVRMGIVGL